MSQKKVALALQGGGAHGAYTWGVLDALLESKSIIPVAISGASAGAINAAALASGWLHDGRHGARNTLEALWRAVASTEASQTAAANAWRSLLGGVTHDAMMAVAGMLARLTSPYERNPLNINPLRDIIAKHIDCDQLSKRSAIDLFVAATPVRTGGLKVFSRKELSTDVLLASACLPTVFHAVDINGVAYWDGGYGGNPPLWPLVGDDRPARDVIIVHVNPLSKDKNPHNIKEIGNRLGEVGFNAPLLGELRALRHLRRMPGSRGLAALFGAGQKPVRLHSIAADDALGEFGADTKMRTDWAFLNELFVRGRETGTAWLHAHERDLGVRDSLDLEALLRDVDGEL